MSISGHDRTLAIGASDVSDPPQGSPTATVEPTPTPNPGAALVVRGLSKSFGGTHALRDVDLEVLHGEVHALIGHNGSGKSTLIKVLAGYHQPEPGAHILVNGEPFRGSAAEGPHSRLRFVHQDLGLILQLDAVDNLALHGGYARGRSGRVLWREQESRARALLGRFGVDLDVRRPLSQATPVQRVVVAIAAALQSWDDDSGLLVLDEPTAVLPPGEVRHLFEIIRELRERGVAVLYVSHRLDEIFDVADRVTVLRGGRHIDTRPVSELTKAQLVTLMLGHEVDPDYRVAPVARSGAPVALEARQLRGSYLRGVDVTLHEGEILGTAGLPGSGSEEIPYAIAGALADSAGGHVRVPRRSCAWSAVAGADDLGVSLVPADRGTEGLITDMSVGENLSLSVVGRLTRCGKLNRRRERRLVLDWLELLGVATPGPEHAIGTLSGGNQQKVLIGRCLARSPAVLALCEPTAGVDVGARRTIYDFIAARAREGLGVVVSSSDVEDLLAICTRVLIVRDGVVVHELRGDAITEHSVVHAMEGTDQDGGKQ